MIYTSCYSGDTKGEVLSISLKQPKNYGGEILEFLAPSEKILIDWKKSKQSQEVWDYIYVPAFQKLLKERWVNVKDWLNSLNPSRDYTLLCYESPQENCHRHLVREIIKCDRPDCWGGEVAFLQQCKNEIIHSNLKVIPPEGTPVFANRVIDNNWVKGVVQEIYSPREDCAPTYAVIALDNGSKMKVYGASQLRLA